MSDPRTPADWPSARADRTPGFGHTQQPVPNGGFEAAASDRQGLTGDATGVEAASFAQDGAVDVTEATQRRREAASEGDTEAEAHDLGEGAPAPNVTP